MRILITDLSSYKAVVIVRYLRHTYPDVEVFATDHRSFVRHTHTRWIHDVSVLPAGPDDGAAYVESIARLVREKRIDLLIPVNSREIRLLVDNRAVLGGALDYMGNPALYARLDDKIAFGNLLQEAGIPAPQTRASIDAALPLVMKPARGSSSKGVVYLRTDEERDDFRARHGTPSGDCVIQDYFEGEGVGYSGYFEGGEIRVGYAHRRVAEHPVSGGSSVVRERYPYSDLPDLVALVERVLAVAPWSGFAMFELKRRGPGDFGFIECNPRIWGSVHQGLSDGANYFEPLLGPGRHAGQTGGRMTALLPLNLISFAGYVRKGRIKPALDILRSLPVARPDINPFTDIRGFIALLRRGP